MRATFRGMWSPDLPDGPGELPQNPDNCWVRITAEIGADDDPGADDFGFYVCTPARIAETLKGGCRFGHALLIVERFDWSVVEDAIRKLCDSTSADTWEGVADRLGRYSDWEYDDYTEPSS